MKKSSYSYEELNIKMNLQKPKFIIVLAIGTIFILVGTVISTMYSPLFPAILVSIGVFIMGVGILLFPFATKKTYDLFGVEKGVVIARLTGVLLIIISFIILFYGICFGCTWISGR